MKNKHFIVSLGMPHQAQVIEFDVRMRQKAGTQTTKIKSAKSFVMVHPRKFKVSML